MPLHWIAPRLLRFVAAMVERDRSLTGATLILPIGEITYLAAGPTRRAGRA
jgi:hypothetical protein